MEGQNFSYLLYFAHLHRRLISIETKMEFYFSEDIQKYHTKRKMYYPVANNHFVHLKKNVQPERWFIFV